MDTTQNSFWVIRAFILALFLAVISSCFGYENRPGPLVLGTRTPPDASALFQMNSVDKGMLLPRMTTAQRDAIPMPANGLVIYNTDLGYPQAYNGGWISLGVAGGGFTEGSVIFANASGLLEEDNGSFFWDDANNRLGIGTITPSVPLEVNGAATITGNITTGIAGQRAVITDVAGVLTDSVTTSTELSYVSGVTSAIQTQLGGKEPTIGTGGGTEYWRGDKTFAVINSDHLTEGVTNLFFTDARAKSAAVADAISNGVTDIAPSQNAVFDALALKADASALTNYVEVAGDTMTGSLRTNQSLTVDVDATVKGNLLLTSDPSVGGMLSGANTKSISINGGAALGTANGAQMQAYGISAGGAQGDLILSAGSGSGEVIFRANGAQVGDIDQNGQWEIGSGGGTETHIVHGNLNGSGSGAFAGSLTVMGNVIGSGSGQFSGQLSAGGNIIGSGSGQFSGKVAILSQNTLELQDSSGGEYARIRAHATSNSHTITLPADNCAVDQVWADDGFGNMTCTDMTGGGGGEKVFLSQNTFDSDAMLADVTCTVGTCTITNTSPIDRDTKYLNIALSAQTANVRGGAANTSWVNNDLEVSCSVYSTLTDVYLCGYTGATDRDCAYYSTAGKVQRVVTRMTYLTGETPQWRIKTLANQTGDIRVDNCTIGLFEPSIIANITNTETWTPTGSWTNTTYTGRKWYHGDRGCYEITAKATGTPTGGNFTVDLPSGDIIDTSKITSTGSDRSLEGQATYFDASAAFGENRIPGSVTYLDTNTVQIATLDEASGSSHYMDTVYSVGSVPVAPAINDAIGMTFCVPIVGRTSGVESIVDTTWSKATISYGPTTNCVPSLGTGTDSNQQITDSDCVATTSGPITAFSTSTALGGYITLKGGWSYEVCWSGNHKYDTTSSLNQYLLLGYCSGTTACASPTIIDNAVVGSTESVSEAYNHVRPCGIIDISTSGDYSIVLKETTQGAASVTDNSIYANSNDRSMKFTITPKSATIAASLRGLPLGPYTPTVTASSCAGWSTVTARTYFFVKQGQDNNWYADFHVVGTHNSLSTCQVSISGIDFSNSISCAGIGGGVNDWSQAFTNGDATIEMRHGTAQTQSYWSCNNIALDSKPTFVP